MSDELRTGVLYCNDNVERLASIPSETVDLIYLDPPFFSNRVYEVIWGDEAEVRSFEDRWDGGIQHYVGWMRDRVTELHRVLKPTGSLYLHCDPHASHYLKTMLDAVFGGMSRFRNEIIWRRTPFKGSSKARARQLPRSHDTILFYAKGDTWTWQGPTVPYSQKYLARFKWDDNDGRGPYRKTLLKTYSPNTEERLKMENRWIAPVRRGAMPSYKQYLRESSGQTQLDDVWTDIDMLNPQSRERKSMGYPTQKPEALLRRILQQSSRDGDVVLDPFCGCGTTVAVAEQLGRRWIGIDVSPTAIEVMRRRMWNQSRCVPDIVDMPDSEASLREMKPFEFQNWVIRALNGNHNPKKTGDMGIDGYSFFTMDPIQVKRSDHVGRPVVDNFETAMRRGGHDTGYIVAFSFTKGAFDEAARAKEDGLTIRLVRVKELLLLVRRPGARLPDIGPQPQGDILPLPPRRKARELPSAEELVASARAASG